MKKIIISAMLVCISGFASANDNAAKQENNNPAPKTEKTETQEQTEAAGGCIKFNYSCGASENYCWEGVVKPSMTFLVLYAEWGDIIYC